MLLGNPVHSEIMDVSELESRLKAQIAEHGQIIVRFLENEVQRTELEIQFYEQCSVPSEMLDPLKRGYEMQKKVLLEVTGSNPLDVLLPVDTSSNGVSNGTLDNVK